MYTCTLRVKIKDADPKTGHGDVFQLKLKPSREFPSIPAAGDGIDVSDGRLGEITVESRTFTPNSCYVQLNCVYCTLAPHDVAEAFVKELGWTKIK